MLKYSEILNDARLGRKAVAQLGSHGGLVSPGLSVFIGSSWGSHITQDAASFALHTWFWNGSGTYSITSFRLNGILFVFLIMKYFKHMRKLHCFLSSLWITFWQCRPLVGLIYRAQRRATRVSSGGTAPSVHIIEWTL